MRRDNRRGRRDTGMPAALKAAAIVLAIGVLALVAGQAAYRSDGVPVAGPKQQIIDPVPDDAPSVAAGMQGGGPAGEAQPRVLAVAPKGISTPEPQWSARPKTTAAEDDEPVATF